MFPCDLKCSLRFSHNDLDIVFPYLSNLNTMQTIDGLYSGVQKMSGLCASLCPPASVHLCFGMKQASFGENLRRLHFRRLPLLSHIQSLSQRALLFSLSPSQWLLNIYPFNPQKRSNHEWLFSAPPPDQETLLSGVVLLELGEHS